jgi:hypothetical protein
MGHIVSASSSLQFETASSDRIRGISAIDLGIDLWHTNNFTPLEAVVVEEISGQFAFAPIRPPNGVDYWITFSLDHVSSSQLLNANSLTIPQTNPEPDRLEPNEPAHDTDAA